MTIKSSNECLIWVMSVILKKIKIKFLINCFALFSKFSIQVMNIFIKFKIKQ